MHISAIHGIIYSRHTSVIAGVSIADSFCLGSCWFQVKQGAHCFSIVMDSPSLRFGGLIHKEAQSTSYCPMSQTCIN